MKCLNSYLGVREGRKKKEGGNISSRLQQLIIGEKEYMWEAGPPTDRKIHLTLTERGSGGPRVVKKKSRQPGEGKKNAQGSSFILQTIEVAEPKAEKGKSRLDQRGG